MWLRLGKMANVPDYYTGAASGWRFILKTSHSFIPINGYKLIFHCRLFACLSSLWSCSLFAGVLCWPLMSFRALASWELKDSYLEPRNTSRRLLVLWPTSTGILKPDTTATSTFLSVREITLKLFD